MRVMREVGGSLEAAMSSSNADAETADLIARDALLESDGGKPPEKPLSKLSTLYSQIGGIVRSVFKMDELGMEIAGIALPAAVGLTADPLSSLVDTIFLGQIGPVELAAVGVSISIFNIVSKVFNLPLVNITTSFVAEDNAHDGDVQDMGSTSPLDQKLFSVTEDNVDKHQSHKQLLPAVSSALVLGLVLGITEAIVLILGSWKILDVMGVPVHSDMRVPAQQYLVLRSVAAPAVVVSLAVQGAFRGFKDTKTPLYATVLGDVANVVLDPLLMFWFRFGVYGAAAATVISEYLIVVVLLWKLNKTVILLPTRMSDLVFCRFLKSGGLLLLRTMATLFTMTVATSMAARLGAIPMAAHQICMQIWLAASLLSDSLALAGQAIIADGIAKLDYERVKLATYRVLQISLGFGVFMAIILGLSSGLFPKLFTNEKRVLTIMNTLIPFVVATQPVNSLAFVFDGVYYGASDFGFSAYSTSIVAAVSSIALFLGSYLWGLFGIWVGLSLFMSLRLVAGFIRLKTASGPWRFLRHDFKELPTV